MRDLVKPNKADIVVFVLLSIFSNPVLVLIRLHLGPFGKFLYRLLSGILSVVRDLPVLSLVVDLYDTINHPLYMLIWVVDAKYIDSRKWFGLLFLLLISLAYYYFVAIAIVRLLRILKKRVFKP